MRLGFLIALTLLGSTAHADDAKKLVLDGRVVGPDGKPIATAKVAGTLEWNDQASTFGVDSVGPDGSFKLELTPSGSKLRSIRVTAWAPGFSNATEVRTVPHGATGYKPVVLAMRPTISFTVKIVDGMLPSTPPVPSATVTIAADSFSTDHKLAGIPQRVDAKGTVTYVGLNDQDSLDLEVAAPGYLPVRWRAELTKPMTIPIVRGGVAKGRFVDLATGKPVACELQSYSGKVTTDANGAFQLTAPYGPIVLWPSCEHYGPDYDNARGGLTIDFAENAAGQIHTVKARRNHVVAVHVVDAAGKPAPNVQVTRVLSPRNPNDMDILWSGPPIERAVTDAKGDVVFKSSSMDAFDLRIEAYRSVQRHVRQADVKGPIAIQLP